MAKGFGTKPPLSIQGSSRAKRRGGRKKPKDESAFKVTRRVRAGGKDAPAAPRKTRREQQRVEAKSPEGHAKATKQARRKRLINLALVIVIVAVTGAGLYSFGYAPNVTAEPLEKVGPVVAKINGLAVHEQNLKVYRGFMTIERLQTGDTTVATDKEVFEEIKRDIVQYQEARHRNLAPRKTDVDAAAKSTRQQFDELFVGSPEGRAGFVEELGKAGLTELEYWSAMYPVIARRTAGTGLLDQVLAAFRPNPPLGGQELADAQEKHWESFVDGLLKKAKVQLLKDSLK